MFQKKQKKVEKLRGSRTHGGGACKKRRGAGNRGGRGNAGSGKRADQKKHSFAKKFGKYLGKRGFVRPTSATVPVINLGALTTNIESFVTAGLAVKEGDKYKVHLPEYKVLGQGALVVPLASLHCAALSESAKKKLETAGCEVTH